MAAINVYLDDEELAWVKRQPRGVVRAIVQNFMAKYPDKVPLKGQK